MIARRVVLTAIAWLCLVCAAAAQTLTFPALSGRVVDEAGILSPTDRAALTETLAAFEAKSTDQLVIVTLKSLQGKTIEDYGYQLGRAWQIGQKDKNNGALLIVAPTERGVRIEVGYGLEGTLTDAVSKYIIDTSILPRFKAGDFPGGIKRGAEDIIQALTGDAEDYKRAAAQNASSATGAPDDGPIWPFTLVVLIGIGLVIFCVTRGGGFCQVLMQILLSMLFSGGRGSSSGGSSSPFSGGGGSFGGGGASGRW
jgi:uncharacterized protein